MSTYDWRRDFIVCEHVADDARIETQGHGLRVCCLACFERTVFLQSEDIHTYGIGGLTVGKVQKGTK